MIALDVKITNIIPKVTKSLLLGLVAMTKYLNGTRKRGGGGFVFNFGNLYINNEHYLPVFLYTNTARWGCMFNEFGKPVYQN